MIPQSYHDWVLYCQSPRAWVFKAMGYRPYEKPGRLTVGNLAHAGIEAHLLGGEASVTIGEGRDDILRQMETAKGDYGVDPKDLTALDRDTMEALKLTENYIEALAVSDWGEIEPLAIESEITHDGVVGHPDLIGMQGDKLVIIDFKTTKYADVSRYEDSMQLDLYAYMLSNINTVIQKDNQKSLLSYGQQEVDWIAYHILTRDGAFAHGRPPYTEVGRRTHEQIKNFAMDMDTTASHPDAPMNIEIALEEERDPWATSSTGYHAAEMLVRHDGIEAALEFLEAHYQWKEVKGNETDIISIVRGLA